VIHKKAYSLPHMTPTGLPVLCTLSLCPASASTLIYSDWETGDGR